MGVEICLIIQFWICFLMDIRLAQDHWSNLIKHKFILMFPILIHDCVDHSNLLPCLSVNPNSNSGKYDSPYHPFYLIVPVCYSDITTVHLYPFTEIVSYFRNTFRSFCHNLYSVLGCPNLVNLKNIFFQHMLHFLCCRDL